MIKIFAIIQKQSSRGVLFFNKVAGLRPFYRLWHRCFPVNFAKFLRTPFLTEHLWWLLLVQLTAKSSIQASAGCKIIKLSAYNVLLYKKIIICKINVQLLSISLVSLVLSGCRGSSAIVPSCPPGYFVSSKFFLVGISWVQNFFSWVFFGSKFFSCGYFVGSKFFLVGISWVQKFFPKGISWVQNFFLWVFCRSKFFFSWVCRGSKMFSRGYFVGLKFLLVGIWWVQHFFLQVFRRFKIFSRAYSVIFTCWSHEKEWCRNISNI